MAVAKALVALPVLCIWSAAALSWPQGGMPGGCTQSSCKDANEDMGELLGVELLQQDLLASKTLDTRGAYGGAAATETTTTTLPPTGLSLNAVGDLTAFVTALVMNTGAVCFLFFVFTLMRARYPIMYNNHCAPDELPTETRWGWIPYVLNLKVDTVAEYITLDHALMLEYTHFAMKTLLLIGVPMMCVMGPINCVLGGYAAGEDHLSYLSYGNIEMGSWIFWIHCFVVWYVAGVATYMTHSAMRLFLDKRFDWLRKLPSSRACTVLIESIPTEYRQEAALREFLTKLIPKCNPAVYVVKDTTELRKLSDKLQWATAKFEEAQALAKNDPENPPKVRTGYMSGEEEAVTYYNKEIKELTPQVTQARKNVTEDAKQIGETNLGVALVTFEERISAEILLRMCNSISKNEEEWEMFSAPQASDILWNDLTQDETAKEVRTAIGYGLVVGLYFLYMPIVIGITNLAKIIDFSNFGLGFIQPFWQGFAPTMGLQFMVAFLPTFLIEIFRNFFTCRAEAWQQHKLQVWYFWFQIVFVVLATAVGQDVRSFTTEILKNPMGIFRVLANTMPYATHFYMNFLVLQWMTHSMNLTRYFPWFKFKMAYGIYKDEKKAKSFAEPEDQDYYGIGSRSARWSIVMTISIVFGTLCPPINVLGFLVFALCRVVYGFLMVYAETKKSDTGGAFWVTQLRQVFVATIIYCILMIGVLLMRASSLGPGIIAIAALVWTVFSLVKFNAYSWEKLPLEELVLKPSSKMSKEDHIPYVQPEMLQK